MNNEEQIKDLYSAIANLQTLAEKYAHWHSDTIARREELREELRELGESVERIFGITEADIFLAGDWKRVAKEVP